MATKTKGRFVNGLVDMKAGKISREIFVNEEIYAEEQEQVFTRAWLFIGHESQVPKPGDYFVSGMGEESVILCRDREGALHVFLNSCRHRGMKVCRYDEGNTPVFTCPYHGWSYATDGKLVYVAWGDNDEYFLVAHDIRNGKEKWRTQLEPSLSKHGHGTGTSPVIFEDLVILLNEHDTGPGYIVALNKNTGKQQWLIKRKIEIMTYATPIIIEVKGEPVLINSCLDDGLMGINPRNGKVLWSTPGNFDLRTVAMPVHWNGIVYGSCGAGGKGKLMLAVKVGGKGNVSKSHIAWKRQRSLPYVPTPIVYGDHIYMWLDNGIVICADPKTGEEIWNERVGRGDFSSSPVCIDGKIYCSSRTGEFTVIKASPKYQLLSRSQLGEATHATPAISNGRMFLRGFEKLYCLEAK